MEKWFDTNGKSAYDRFIMGTEKHSRASKKRWAHISKVEKQQRMSSVSKSGWSKLDKKARRKRALKGVQTRKQNVLSNRVTKNYNEVAKNI